MAKSEKFILTKSKKTADELVSQGFTFVNFSNGIFIFLNNSDVKLNFNNLEQKSYVFTNNMYF